MHLVCVCLVLISSATWETPSGKINNNVVLFLFLFFLRRVSPGFSVPRVSLGFQDSQELRWVTSARHCDVVYHSVGGIFCSEWDGEYYEPVMMRRKHFDWWLSHPISAIPLSFCSHYPSLSRPLKAIKPLLLQNVTWKWSEWDNPLPLPLSPDIITLWSQRW